jgi:histidinol-phosphate aminotransferase
MSRFCTKIVDGILPYVPGEQPQDKKYIKLNTNENPYFLSESAVNAVTSDEVRNLKLYSDPEAKKVTEAVANFYRVDKSNVLLSNGSDEILAFSFLAFCAGKKTAFADVTYGFYKVYAEIFGAIATEIPLKPDFSLDEEAFKNFDGNVILANPNAQTGLFVDNSRLEKIISAHSGNLVLIDEAYADFARSSCVELIKKYDNLLIVGTFSKSRSLAGARLGFAISNSEIISDLKKVKYSFNPYNINRLTQIVGEKAMKNIAYFEETRDKIIATRERLKSELAKLGFETTDSKANFVLTRTPKLSGKTLYQKLRENGILVRHFDDERISGYVRITIGTDEDTDKLIETIKLILKENS